MHIKNQVYYLILFCTVLYLLNKILLYSCEEEEGGGGLAAISSTTKLLSIDNDGNLESYIPGTDGLTTNSLSIGDTTVSLKANAASTDFNNTVTSNGLINANSGLKTTNLGHTGAARLTGLLTSNGLTTNSIASTNASFSGDLTVNTDCTLKGEVRVKGTINGNQDGLNIFTTGNGTVNLSAVTGVVGITNLQGNNIIIGGRNTSSITFNDSGGYATLTAKEISDLKSLLLNGNNTTFVRADSRVNLYAYNGSSVGDTLNNDGRKVKTASGWLKIADYVTPKANTGFVLQVLPR